MPGTKRKRASASRPKALSVQMSTQFKVFLSSLPPAESRSVLDAVDKIARGEIKGKKVDWTELPEDVRRSIEASERELLGKKPTRA